MKILALSVIASLTIILTLDAQSRIADQTKTNKFIVEPPTLICAGFEWQISGDENRNATVSVDYRKLGETEWIEGHPLMRIGGEKIYGHEQRWVYTTPHMFAGSIFNLDPDTMYECRFQLTDPDGVEGRSEYITTVKTKSEPQPYAYGQVYHVYPPGFEGKKEEPSFTGLNEAYYGEGAQGDWWLVPDARVEAGDVILVHAGLYKGDQLNYVDPLGLNFHGAYVFTQKGTREKPITIKAAGDGEVIFDGNGAYRLFDVMAADYHYFEGLTIRNTQIAFYAGLKHVMGSTGLTVKNCKIEDIGIAVMTHSEDSKDFYIADNIMLGRHDPDTLIGWHGFEEPAPLTSYYAVKVYGQSHVVCHNFISNFHDGICVDTHGLPEEGQDKKCVSIDFYRNDIFNTSDDFIEADGGVHNIRIFENRGFNSYHASLSAQPVFGGPVYFIRNICYNTPGTALKHVIRPAGIYVYNNTFITEAAITGFSNGHFKNNLFIGPNENRQSLSATTFTNYSTMDYNGYRVKSGEGAKYRWRYPPADSLNNADASELPVVEFMTLKEFGEATGFEVNGVEVDFNIFENVPVPDNRGFVYPLNGKDFRLMNGSVAIDAGVNLPNITDGYIGNAPDLGALEYPQVVPVYGPRTN
ncbi:MAG: hypothetical protein O2887_17110 [Bacteroidetes bacterium]|nr:hypothetical protein [Bacteroidota bacterium]MDA1122180.1 hypothetical protein [Bacteroidota bacterium]